MKYSQEDIENYLEILERSQQGGFGGRHSPRCCENPQFTIWNGYRLCESCCTTSGHILGYHDTKDYERLFYRKKSVYERKYYYEKKVNIMATEINLESDKKSELYEKLMEIDNLVTKKLNQTFNRKRMISIQFLMKKILGELGYKEESDKVFLKISNPTLKNYEQWWTSYKNL